MAVVHDDEKGNALDLPENTAEWWRSPTEFGGKNHNYFPLHNIVDPNVLPLSEKQSPEMDKLNWIEDRNEHPNLIFGNSYDVL